MDIVVGSGPAGAAAASALLAQGRRVHMLDGGNQLEPERAAAVERCREAAEPWSPESAPWHAEGASAASQKIPRKLLFGSDYPYRDTERELGLVGASSGLEPSLAFGGLSTVWGTALLPYVQRDIADWPITAADLDAHYKAVVKLTGLSAEQDDLAELLPLHTDTLGDLPISRQARRIRASLDRNRAKLRGAGITHGRGRVAIRALNPASGGQGCVACGMCLSGCPWGHTWSAQRTVGALAGDQRFSRQGGVIVVSVEERGGQAIVRGRDRATGAPFELAGERVFLGAGVIPTAGILLRSLGAYGRTIHILDSQYFLLPALMLAGTPGVAAERLHTLSQLFLEISDAAISPYLSHVQVYTYNSLIGARVRSTLGPLAKLFGGAFAKEFEGRLIALQGYVHSAHSSRLAVTLSKTADGERLSVVAEINPEAERIVKKLASKLFLHSLDIGAVPLTPMLEVSEPGRGFHAGGSFPMRRKPQGFETDPLGRPAGWSRVHVVDASVLPSIPATTITFSVMANAQRIATEAVGQA